MKILITICARGGSKGIPGKNIKLLNGKPLIAYTIDCAKKFAEKYKAHIELSTDDDQIKRIASGFGLDTEYKRPATLATDKAGKIETIRDVLIYAEQAANTRFDVVLDLDVTSPLRTQDDLEKGLNILMEDKEAYNVFSVNSARRNPYFNMVERKENGYYNLVVKNEQIKSRQQAPAVYDMNASFYFYRRDFFDTRWGTSVTERSLIYVMNHTCFDLDEPQDFVIMEALLREKLLNIDV